jgi:hypothetical protein
MSNPYYPPGAGAPYSHQPPAGGYAPPPGPPPGSNYAPPPGPPPGYQGYQPSDGEPPYGASSSEPYDGPPDAEKFGPPRRQDSFGPPVAGGFHMGYEGGQFGAYDASNPQAHYSYVLWFYLPFCSPCDGGTNGFF